ncbi:MAG: hypothetical protein Q9216_005200 [Gyalolechia sp. 2 TL-2023]
MDPISVLAAVGTTLLTVKEVWQCAQWMQKIYELYTEGDKFLQQIALECYIYGESIKAIGHWLRKNQSSTRLRRQMRITHNAIVLVQVSMENVSRDLTKFKDGVHGTSTKDTKLSKQKQDMKMFQQFISKQKQDMKMFQQFITNKAKQQWFSETMRLHLIELRAHTATLHLALGVIELAGHSQDHQEKEPEKLEAKTGKLEKRLMLRQFLTKALHIKRAEVVGLAGRGDTGQSPLTSLPSSKQTSPQKLTFYDVVQLARQQAFVEKTRKSNEDLIDLSEATHSPPLRPMFSSIQSDLMLLDSNQPISPHSVSPDPSSPRPVELDSLVQGKIEQPSIAELDANLSLTLRTTGATELVEADASGANTLRKEGAETRNQTGSEIHELRETLINEQGNTNDQPSLEVGETGPPSIVCPDTKEAIELCSEPAPVDLPGSTRQFKAKVDAPMDEDPEVKSLKSSTAPSIFSHSSSLTGATGLSSLAGITEEDVHSRNVSSILLPPNATTAATANLLVQQDPSITTNMSDISSASPRTSQEPSLAPQRSCSQDDAFLPTSRSQLLKIDEPDEHGFPWIVQAARDGNEEIIRKLLVSRADVQATHTSTRRHALAEASFHGHTRTADLLIDEGCSLEQTDSEGNTALHHACQQGHLAIAKSLIFHGAPIDATGSEGRSALHFAMEAPTYQNIVMLLIQHKAHVNARDASHRTPLHIGAHQGNLAMCNYLLSEGTQLDAREVQSKTSLHLASEAGHYDLVQMLLYQSQLYPTSMTFLAASFAAVEHGHVRITKAFFSQGLKLQELKRDMHKPLTLAAKSGYLAMVELMVQEECDLNARDEGGWNALHFASHYGHYQVIETLLTSGVSAKATTSRKETPLILAIKGSHFPVAERLLRNDSSLVNLEDERGQQPIHHAVRGGSLEIFNLLMSNGGKVSGENSFGWHPLHIATAYGYSALVERLLQYGANIEEKLGSSSIKKDQTHKIVEEGYWAEARWPYPGSRALHLACEYGHEPIANLLISKGAKIE